MRYFKHKNDGCDKYGIYISNNNITMGRFYKNDSINIDPTEFVGIFEGFKDTLKYSYIELTKEEAFLEML